MTVRLDGQRFSKIVVRNLQRLGLRKNGLEILCAPVFGELISFRGDRMG
jgi:hypothetical protein